MVNQQIAEDEQIASALTPEVLEAMLADKPKVDEPGAKAGDKVEMPTDSLLTPVVAAVSSAGYREIYERATGERSVCNTNMLPRKLRERTQDGSPRYSLSRPAGKVPFRGNLKCWLHPDDPRRGHFDELGLGTCKKQNLRSQLDVRLHVQAYHTAAYAIIREEGDNLKEQQRVDREMATLKALERMSSISPRTRKQKVS